MKTTLAKPDQDTQLAPYAARAATSRGRRYPEPAPTYRSEYQRDRDRIIHCAAFRRLEYKTQVFVNHEGDMFRTRLTHSIEVAQIARAVARTLRLNEDLAEAISLAHDLGHTAFGHAGQDELNDCMKDYGGFEHNLQSLRVVDELEERYAEFPGLNLTFETREGILKHCSRKNAQELGDVGVRFLKNLRPALEAQLANIADEIAYNNHDVDDGLRSGLITIEQLRAIPLFNDQYETVLKDYPQLAGRRIIHEVVRRMIGRQVNDLVVNTHAALAQAQPQSVEAVRHHPEVLVRYSEDMRAQNLQLKQFLRTHLYQHYRVLRMSAKAKRTLRGLFEAYMEEPRLLPTDYQTQAQAMQVKFGEAGRARIVADYIAGMTDRYAITEYERLFNPKLST